MRYWVLDPKKRDASGPFDVADLRKLPGFGPESVVAPDGAGTAEAWKPARNYPDLSDLFRKPPPLPPAPPAKPPIASEPPRSLPGSRPENRFEISERLETRMDETSVIDTLYRQLSKVATQIERRDHELEARSIGMKNSYSNSFATVRLVRKDYGFLCVVSASSNPAWTFWGAIIFALVILPLFGIGFLMLAAVIGKYFWGKNRIHTALAEAIARVRDEVA